MPSGKEALKQLVLAQVLQIELYGDRISPLCGWDEISSELLHRAIDLGLVTDNVLRDNIHKRLLVLGRESYDQHMKTQTPPDHVSSPEALGYSLHISGVFTARERRLIEFDHGDTIETFMAGRIHDLVERVLESLKTWKPSTRSASTGRFPACC
jgi:hypothetical protein